MPNDALAKIGGITKALERRFGELRADLLVALRRVPRLRVVVEAVVRPPPRDVGLAEVVEQRSQAHAQRRAGVGRGLDDLERVLVDRHVVVPALLFEPDRLLELRQQVHEHAGVAGKPQRLRRMLAQQQLRELAHPVRREPAADALTRDTAHAVRRRLASARASARPDRGRAARRSAARGRVAADPRQSCSASRSASIAALEVARGRCSGSTILPVASRRAIALIVKSRRSRSSSTDATGRRRSRSRDGQGRSRSRAAAGRARCRLGASLRTSASRGRSARPRAVRRRRALRPPVWFERGTQAGDVDAGHEEVRVFRLVPEQLVAHRAADDVRVQPERPDVLLDERL